MRAAAAALLVLLVVGCSDDGEPATRGTTTAPVATSPGTTRSAESSTTPSATPGTDVGTTVPVDPPPLAIGEAVATFDEPVDLAVRANDDTLYVVERAGRVIAWSDGESATVLDITDQTVAEGERGLLGLAFAPSGDRAWVDYTDLDGDTVIAEFDVSATGEFTNEREVLTVDQPHANHNGGDLAIGPDGMLYIGMGDGGSANDPDRRALDTGDLLGKMLRIDPTPRGGEAYSIPSDNPFTDTEGARPEIWSIGLRNPWRFTFDAATGDLWIADVGQGDEEEIDVLPAGPRGMGAGRGASLGWSAFEGERRFNEDQPAEGHLPPFYVYDHEDGRCSISGGSVYRGDGIPGLGGWYLFGDWCSGEVWALEVLRDGRRRDHGRLEAVGDVPGVVTVASGPDGELWALSLQGGLFPVVAA